MGGAQEWRKANGWEVQGAVDGGEVGGRWSEEAIEAVELPQELTSTVSRTAVSLRSTKRRDTRAGTGGTVAATGETSDVNRLRHRSESENGGAPAKVSFRRRSPRSSTAHAHSVVPSGGAT